jgi:hypothetical protein
MSHSFVTITSLGIEGCRGDHRPGTWLNQAVFSLAEHGQIAVPDQHAVQQFRAQRHHSAFRDRVHARHPETGQHYGNRRTAEDRDEQRGVFGVAVTDEEPGPREVSGVLSACERRNSAQVTACVVAAIEIGQSIGGAERQLVSL